MGRQGDIEGDGMTDKPWKKDEREIAARFGTTRTPLSGGNGKQTRSDTLSPDFFIEIKRRKSFPFRKLFLSVREMARKENKVPLMVIHENGTAIDNSIVILRLGDLPLFVKGYGRLSIPLERKTPEIVLKRTENKNRKKGGEMK